MKINQPIDYEVLKVLKKEKQSGVILLDSNYEATDSILLEKCYFLWDGLVTVRYNRNRTRKYLMGDQWGELIKDPDSGETITEEEYISRNGGVPLKQNMIRALDKSLKGQYRLNPASSTVISRTRDNQQTGEMMNCALEYVKQINDTKDKDAFAFGEFALSGIPIQKLSWSHFDNKDRKDIKIKNINPNQVFFNTDIEENNGEDLSLIGQIIDLTLDELISTFAKTKADEEKLKAIYTQAADEDSYVNTGLNADKVDNFDFYIPYKLDKCRVYEVWYKKGEWRMECHDTSDGTWQVHDISKKELEEENQRRILEREQLQALSQEELEPPKLIEYTPKFERVWYVKYLTPLGHCILKMETPYEHDEHPFAFYAYPLIDGETWGFLQDFIDQQRQINRILMLWDLSMSASVKGFMMVPEDVIGDKSPEEFALEIKKFNGVVFYKPKPHAQVPKHIKGSSVPAGINELLQIHMKLINDISGVNEAMQGQAPPSGTSGTSYMQQAQNSSVNILDYMHSFGAFIKSRDYKISKMIAQFYQEPRYLAVAGKSYSEDVKQFNPEAIKDLEMELVVQQSTDAPIFRMAMEEQLNKLLDGQFIDILQYLEHSAMPYADKLSETIKNAQQQQQGGGQVSPEMMAEMQQNGGQVDPRAMQMLQQGINQQ